MAVEWADEIEIRRRINMADMDDAYRQAEHLRDFLFSYIAARDAGRRFHIEIRLKPDEVWDKTYTIPERIITRAQYRLVFEPREFWVNEYPEVLGYRKYDSPQAAIDDASARVLRQVRFVESLDEDA